MNAALGNRVLLWAKFLFLALGCEVHARATDLLPDASSVIARLEQRGADDARTGQAGQYTYRRYSKSEELDSYGKVTKTTEKIYEVVPIEGFSFSRLIKIQGRDLNEEEKREQARKEMEFRRRLADKRHPKTRDEELLNVGLIARYDFKVEKREFVQNRAVLALSFRPKQNRAPEESVRDRVLNRLAGTLWVDEAEAEVVRVEVGLTEDLWLGWFGVVGSLKKCDFKIERQRLPEGVWVDKGQTVELEGRKVFTSLRYRNQEGFEDFRKS